MEFVNDPVKSKRVFILMLILTIVFFLGAGVLGYFYYAKNKAYRSLSSEKTNLENQQKSSADLQKQIDTLTKENTDLTKTKKDQKDQIDSWQAKAAKARAYNDVMRYFAAITKAHNGFDGWTDVEYQTGRAKAQATGDTAFVNTVDWAWNRKDVSQMDRAVGFWNAVCDGIDNSLK